MEKNVEDVMSAGRLAKKIVELETENRRLTEALKSQETPPMRVEMNWAPIYDAKIELTRLVGIMGAAIYLSHPGEDDTEKEYVITALLAIQEQIADLAEGLDGALDGMKILDRSGATESAPAAVAVAAGA